MMTGAGIVFQSLGIEVNPLYLMLPTVICCSYAFMLPAATAPNAIVFAGSGMKSMTMVSDYCLFYNLLIHQPEWSSGERVSLVLRSTVS